MSGFSKTIVSGELGSLSVSESAGNVSLTATAGGKLGGGEASGVASFSASVSINLSAKQIVDLGLELAASKYPSAAAAIKGAQALIDAEISAN